MDALVPATLGEVQVDDFRTDLLQRDVAAYPVAILSTPSIESRAETNRDNTRTYNFDILVIQKGENVASASDIETLIEALLDPFDNDPNLGGTADGGVVPSTSTPQAITSGDKTFIVFTVTLRISAFKNLTSKPMQKPVKDKMLKGAADKQIQGDGLQEYHFAGGLEYKPLTVKAKSQAEAQELWETQREPVELAQKPNET